jgi:hypothetical protein
MPISLRLASHLAVILWALLLEVKMKQYPSQEYLNSILEYRDGELYWKKNMTSTVKEGMKAGHLAKDGRVCIRIKTILYKRYRIVWIMFNGNIPDNLVIDHIDRNPLNDKIENLRLLSHSLNLLNTDAKNIITRKRKYGIAYIAYYVHNGIYKTKTFYTEQDAIDWISYEKSKIFDEYYT